MIRLCVLAHDGFFVYWRIIFVVTLLQRYTWLCWQFASSGTFPSFIIFTTAPMFGLTDACALWTYVYLLATFLFLLFASSAFYSCVALLFGWFLLIILPLTCIYFHSIAAFEAKLQLNNICSYQHACGCHCRSLVMNPFFICCVRRCWRRIAGLTVFIYIPHLFCPGRVVDGPSPHVVPIAPPLPILTVLRLFHIYYPLVLFIAPWYCSVKVRFGLSRQYIYRTIASLCNTCCWLR